MKTLIISCVLFSICIANEYPYYTETTNGGLDWSEPGRLPAISEGPFLWCDLDCIVINNLPFAVHNSSDEIMQLFYPDPDTPGTPGSWNWIVLNVQLVGDGSFAWQDTTWTMSIVGYPNLSIDSSRNIILLSYKCNFEINPPSVGWTDGNYLGGIISSDGGRNWLPCRPMSGPLLQTTGGPIEVAHRLITTNDTTFVYSTWTDAGDGVIGNQYFELGIVQSVWWWNIDGSKRVSGKNDYLTSGYAIQQLPNHSPMRVLIAEVGGENSILGPAGKNICVASNGATIAVTYGPPSEPYDVNKPFNGLGVAYSVDRGVTWSLYHSFCITSSGPFQRISSAVDGATNFWVEAGILFFAWQEGQLGYNPNLGAIIIEENNPPYPSFSTPNAIPNDKYPWMPCIGVNPDNNMNVMVTAWSHLANGDNANYAWISNDGGYSIGNNILVTPPVDTNFVSIGAGHFRWGTGGYAFFTYHDNYDPAVDEHNINTFSIIPPKVVPTVVKNICQILFNMRKYEKCSIKLVDVSGRLVKTIIDGNLNSGDHEIYLNTNELARGVYIVTLETSTTKQNAKFIKVE